MQILPMHTPFLCLLLRDERESNRSSTISKKEVKIMKHADFNFHQHGFVGHLAEPDAGSDRAVIVIMGGEQSLLPGIKLAERFADYGITGLAVSMFGADGIPDAPNQIPLDMFLPAVNYLKIKKRIEHIRQYVVPSDCKARGFTCILKVKSHSNRDYRNTKRRHYNVKYTICRHECP